MIAAFMLLLVFLFVLYLVDAAQCGAFDEWSKIRRLRRNRADLRRALPRCRVLR